MQSFIVGSSILGDIETQLGIIDVNMDYTTLITSEHKKPKFKSLVSLLTNAIGSNTQLMQNISSYYDIDTAVGAQLDVLGQWIGFSRFISPSITNAFFSLDDPILGLDSGYLAGLYDSGGVTALDDNTYRLLLYAKIALNHWDGSLVNAIAGIQAAFPNNTIIIQDNLDMTMNIGITGPITPLIQALLVRGYFDIRPAGVLVNAYIWPDATSPFFGLDFQNSTVSGLDTGVLNTNLS